MVVGIVLIAVGIFLLAPAYLSTVTYDEGVAMIERKAAHTPWPFRWAWGWHLPKSWGNTGRYLHILLHFGVALGCITYGLARVGGIA